MADRQVGAVVLDDDDPKERFVYHAAGMDGLGDSIYIDAMVPKAHSVNMRRWQLIGALLATSFAAAAIVSVVVYNLSRDVVTEQWVMNLLEESGNLPEQDVIRQVGTLVEHAGHAHIIRASLNRLSPRQAKNLAVLLNYCVEQNADPVYLDIAQWLEERKGSLAGIGHPLLACARHYALATTCPYLVLQAMRWAEDRNLRAAVLSVAASSFEEFGGAVPCSTELASMARVIDSDGQGGDEGVAAMRYLVVMGMESVESATRRLAGKIAEDPDLTDGSEYKRLQRWLEMK